MVGVVSAPYDTIEEIAAQNGVYQGIAAFGVCFAAGYFPSLLATERAVQSCLPGLLTLVAFPLGALLVLGIARLFGGEGTYRQYLASWGFTYLPTASVFLFAFAGRAAILAFGRDAGPVVGQILMLVDALLLLWKLLLLATVLRVVGNMDFKRLFCASALVLLVAALAWWAALRAGLARVPFI